MKNIFLDTNFVIDYFIREEYNQDSERFLSIGRRLKYQFYISYLTVANFAYIMRKLPSDKLISLIYDISNTFRVIDNTNSQIQKAILLNCADFEDALQYQAALDANCDCIITRNQSDFSFSKIPVMSATEYISKMYDQN